MIYSTIQGDTWDMISLKTLGDEGYISQLIDANPDYASTVLFSGGIILNIPVKPEANLSGNLPPWRKGI